ncbi:putative Anti-sigma factor antagonist [Candidatus Terasakiella magnetica]|uniref:Anti-sigma factor antagonist n=1 Tax=Candidatus Terasakiella magnetica TaxID=1867952 RepID=A0A1C3RI29_9PROT|nr:STAS domain-containing protein [Candidatus Terasakiella magnetica]SCA56925.1 putative Anti-sigma factor antagonist [Candidatus Terasakiella magnetica]
MDHSITENNGVIQVKLTGELTLNDEEKFRSLSLEASEQSGSKCVIDLSALEFLDSAGLGLLLVLKEFCEDASKTVSIRPGGGEVREILDISEFSSLIPYEE